MTSTTRRRGYEVQSAVTYRSGRDARHRDPYFQLFLATQQALADYCKARDARIEIKDFESHRTRVASSVGRDGRVHDANVLVLQLKSVSEIASFADLLGALRATLATDVDVAAARDATSAEHVYALSVTLPEPPEPRWALLRRALLLAVAIFAALLVYWLVARTAGLMRWVLAVYALGAEAIEAGAAGAGASAGAAASGPRPNPSIV